MITCSRCSTRWTGLSRAHCAACHRTFTTVGLFDRHRSRVGAHGSCVDPSTVGLVLRGDGMWGAPPPDPTQRPVDWWPRDGAEVPVPALGEIRGDENSPSPDR